MNRTKLAIVDTFWQLLEEKPYNKITGYCESMSCK